MFPMRLCDILMMYSQTPTFRSRYHVIPSVCISRCGCDGLRRFQAAPESSVTILFILSPTASESRVVWKEMSLCKRCGLEQGRCQRKWCFILGWIFIWLLLLLLYKSIQKEVNLIDSKIRFRETDFPRWLLHFLYYLYWLLFRLGAWWLMLIILTFRRTIISQGEPGL